MKQKQKRKVRKGILSKLLSPILFVLSLVLAFQIYRLNILPVQYLLPILIVIVVLTLILLICSYTKTHRVWIRRFTTFMTVLLTIVYSVGNYYIYKTDELFARIDDLATKITNTISVRVMKNSSIKDADQLNGVKVGVCLSQDQTGTQKMLDSLQDKGVSVEQEDFDSLTSMTAALYDGQIDAMILNDAYLGLVHDTEPFTFITTDTKTVDQLIYYTDRTHQVEDSKDQVNVTQQPFSVLISGNDTYGSLAENSRSDVNMIVTVNPKTGVILMTSIPRDYYLEVDCPSQNGCLAGQMDKLTHTGIRGVETTEATLEKALGININYTVRVNFSSLVNLVDALGGIDIDVPEGMAVKTFYANETLEGVKEGRNHLEGERALAFARERHAYVDGDTQRVRNQQTVLRAIIDKITSPAILMNYGKFVDAIGGAFETDMPASQIKDLMRFQLARNPHWKFESYSLRGEGSTEYCAELGDYAYVTVPDEYSVEIARQKLQAVLNGESADSIKDEQELAPAGAFSQEDTSEQDEEIDQEEDSEDPYPVYENTPAYDEQIDEGLSAYENEDPLQYNSSNEEEAYNPNWSLDSESQQYPSYGE